MKENFSEFLIADILKKSIETIIGDTDQMTEFRIPLIQNIWPQNDDNKFEQYFKE